MESPASSPFVLLDANVLIADPGMRSFLLKLVLKEARRGTLDVRVPELVVQEVGRKLAEIAQKGIRDLRKSRRSLERLGLEVPSLELDLDVAALRSTFEQRTRSRLQEVGVLIVDFPTASHEQLVARLLDRRKPFRPEGGGYRDALIWATAMELASERPVALISKNTRGTIRSRPTTGA